MLDPPATKKASVVRDGAHKDLAVYDLMNPRRFLVDRGWIRGMHSVRKALVGL